jgi:hypothetical protein
MLASKRGEWLTIKLTLTHAPPQAPSKTAGPGECYNMPKGVLMAGANTGKGVAELYDIYFMAPGKETTTIREPVCFRNVMGKVPKLEYYRCPPTGA